MGGLFDSLSIQMKVSTWNFQVHWKVLKIVSKEPRTKLWIGNFLACASLIDRLYLSIEISLLLCFFFDAEVTICQAGGGPHRWVVEQKRKQDWALSPSSDFHLEGHFEPADVHGRGGHITEKWIGAVRCLCPERLLSIRIETSQSVIFDLTPFFKNLFQTLKGYWPIGWPPIKGRVIHISS